MIIITSGRMTWEWQIGRLYGTIVKPRYWRPNWPHLFMIGRYSGPIIPGTRVRLRPPIEIEDEPQEEGVVLTVDYMPWGTSLIVLVDPTFHVGPDDDGLRECTADQVEVIE